ncbi:MAG TPA: GDSL-type esterase/lipase family protein [Gammaproteobacteria bacterium]|nr:GDSL-type esterase/lipase family protein [Gammaproteobacteria bacterium]
MTKILTLTLTIIMCAHAYSCNLLLVGDSLSTGYGLKTNKSWVKYLEKELNNHQPPFALNNVSISGMTSKEASHSISSWLKEYQPSIIVIELGGNDVLQGVHPKIIKSNIENIIVKSAQYGCVVLLEIPHPQHYPIEYITQIKNLSKTLAHKHKINYIPSFFKNINQKDFFQNDGIHPNEKAQPLLFNNVWSELSLMLINCQSKIKN